MDLPPSKQSESEDRVKVAFDGMKARGWGFVWSGHTVAIGPITNPDYEETGEPPLINVLGMDRDPVAAYEKAVASLEKR